MCIFPRCKLTSFFIGQPVRAGDATVTKKTDRQTDRKTDTHTYSPLSHNINIKAMTSGVSLTSVRATGWLSMRCATKSGASPLPLPLTRAPPARGSPPPAELATESCSQLVAFLRYTTRPSQHNLTPRQATQQKKGTSSDSSIRMISQTSREGRKGKATNKKQQQQQQQQQ